MNSKKPKSKHILSHSERALLENGMALILDIRDHIRRASVIANDPDMLGHLLGASKSLAKLRKLFLARLDKDPAAQPPRKSEILGAFDQALTLLEATFQDMADIKSQLEAHEQVDPLRENDETTR